MKKLYVLAAPLALFLLCSSINTKKSYSQNKKVGYNNEATARLNLGSSFPDGSLSDSYKWGLSGRLELIYPLVNSVDLGVSGSIQRYPFDESSLEEASIDGLESWIYNLYAKVRLRPSSSSYGKEYVPYTFGGIGVSNINISEGEVDGVEVDGSTQSGLGLTGGIGVRFIEGHTLDGYILEVKYAYARTEAEPVEHFTISIGVILSSR